MSTANERRALWFLAAVALSGSAVRLARGRTLDRPPDPAVERQLARVDSARAARAPRGAKAAGRSTAARVPGAGAGTLASMAHPPPVDLESATAEQLEALPGIGPALAERIVAHRDSAGRFGDLSGLCQVRGIGPVLASRLRPLVVFGGIAPAPSARCVTGSEPAAKRPRTRGAKQG